MKINPRTPLERHGAIMTGPFETDEQHGRELIRRGYATLVDDTGEANDKDPAKRSSRKSKPKDAE